MLKELRIVRVLAVGFLAASGVAAQALAPLGTNGNGEGRIESVRSAAAISTVNGFVENLGQWDDEVLFFARAGGIEATVLADAIVLRPRPAFWDREQPGPPAPPVEPLVLRFVDAGSPEVVGLGELPTLHHYFQGDVRVANARGFASVRFEDVAPGVDVELTERGGLFAYDVHAQPGAPLWGFAIEVEGAERVEQRAPGEIVLHTAAGEVVQRIGASWQEHPTTHAREVLTPEFRTLNDATESLRFGFSAPGRDPSHRLVIDPTLEWATYVGGSTGEQFISQGMAVDANGSVHLACRVGLDAPTTPGAFQPDLAAGVDAWVGKLSPDGSFLEWGTYLGGAKTDYPVGVAIAAGGSVVVAGDAWSADFPTTPGSLQEVHSGSDIRSDLFVTCLHPSGSSLIWSTLYGDPDSEGMDAMELFPSGDVLVVTNPVPSQMTVPPPVGTPGTFDPVFDLGDRMLLRLSADGTNLVFVTYFRVTKVRDVAIDADSNIYLGAEIAEADGPAPTTPGAFQETMPQPTPPGVPGYDGVVAKLDGTASRLSWCTYLGGAESSDFVTAIGVDAASSVYVVGDTSSVDFPVTSGALEVTKHDGFVTKIQPDGSALVWSTYLGSSCGATGCGGSSLHDIEVDVGGAVLVVGSSNESTFPTTPDAFQPDFVGAYPSGDVFLAKLDAFGERLTYATWFGGSGTDYFPSIAIDGNRAVYLGLQSYSTNAPVTAGAYDTISGGSSDLVVAKFDFSPPAWKIRAPWQGGSVLVGGPPPPPGGAPSSCSSGPEDSSRFRLSGRGAPRHSTGWVLVRRVASGARESSTPDTWIPVSTDEQGALDLILARPALRSESTLLFQVWIRDVAAPTGWSLSNTLEGRFAESD